MDFQSLTRKELQTLCKRNKIPANITNVAMADALKALEIVEGLEELNNRCESPEKTMNKASQEIPSTATRTSTRRKTTVEEHQSTQPTIRTRARKTTRTLELDEANKNVNVPETPVTAATTSRRAQKTEPEVKEQRKSDLLETPALQSCRRRPRVGSSRRKVEAQKEGSLQHGYGTRRSVRLLEKSMSGLCLKESEKMEKPVKIDEMVEGEVENKNGQSEATSEMPLARNLSASLEDEGELKDDFVENSEFNNGESDCTLISEAGSRTFDNLDGLSAIDTKDVSPNEKNNEPEGEKRLADIPDVIIDPKGSDHFAVSEDLYETVLNEISVSDEIDDVAVSEDSYEIDNLNEELVVDETKSIDVLAADAFEDISEEVFDHSSTAADMEPIDAASLEAYGNHAPKEIEPQELHGKDCEIKTVDDVLTKLLEAEGCDKGEVSQNVSVLPKGHMDSSEKKGNEESHVDAFLGNSDIDDDTGSDNNSLADELQEEVLCEHKSISIPTAACSSEDPVTSMVDEEVLVDVDVAEAETIHVSSFQNASQSVLDDIPVHKMVNYVDAEALVDVNVSAAETIHVSSFHNASQSAVDGIIPVHKMVNDGDAEALVDVNVAEAETIHVSSFHNASQSVVDDIPVHKMVNEGDAEALIDVCVKLAKEFSDTPAKLMSPSPCIVSNSEIITTSTAQFSKPTSFTPSKKQTTIPKVIQVIDNTNKENIDNNNSLKDVEPCLGKLKKNKNIIDEEIMQNLQGLSLRNLKKLTKMFDRLEITDNMKNKEDKNVCKQSFGKSRPALQTLPQNSEHTGEAEKQN